MNTNKPRILLVEDDLNLGYVIKDNLHINGYEVTLCEDGEKGLEASCVQKFDLCILDIMLPKKDGFSIAEEIRKKIAQKTVILRREKTQITVSIGISIFPKNAQNIVELIHKADLALYQAKKEGRNRVCVANV